MDLEIKEKAKKEYTTISLLKESKALLKKYCKENNHKVIDVIEALIKKLDV